jgi:hypothetical protein
MHVLGGELHHLSARAPSQCAPGEEIPILVRPEDKNNGLSFGGVTSISARRDGKELQHTVETIPGSTCLRVRLRIDVEGIHRLLLRDDESGLEASTNPIVCRSRKSDRNVYWGMIHGHTEMSDGAGSIEHYFRQMKEEAALHFGAPGDHDHTWETSDRMWRDICEAVARWNEPLGFVTFLGYEWAKWRKNGDGDRNVYFREDHRPIYRSDDGHFPTPPDLFRALREEQAIIIPHHTANAGNWCDWKDHDMKRERLVEIFQCRGSYESQDGPAPEKSDKPPKPEGFVSRALEMGWRVGFTAGGDDHAGHAGTDFLAGPYKSGLTAVFAEELTRRALWDALWNRRTVATTGPRILLHYMLNENELGTELNVASAPELRESRRLNIEFHGTAPVERVEVMRNNAPAHVFDEPGLDGALEWTDEKPLSEVALPPAKFCPTWFCFYYVRMVQTDGEVAWASPIWIDLED